MTTVWPEDVPVTAEEEEYFEALYPDPVNEESHDFWANVWEDWMH